MANQDSVEQFRNEYKDLPDVELIHLAERYWAANPIHLAATQILHQRQKEREANTEAVEKLRHEQSLQETRNTNRLSWIAIGIAILSLIIALLTWLFPHK